MLIFHLLCYAAVLKILTYYAQYYAQEKELCLVYYHNVYQWRRKGGLEGLEPPQLSRKGGRAPPKLYVCDVINIS